MVDGSRVNQKDDADLMIGDEAMSHIEENKEYFTTSELEYLCPKICNFFTRACKLKPSKSST